MCNRVTVIIDEPEHICIKSDYYVSFEPEKLPDKKQERRAAEISLRDMLREKIKGLSIRKDGKGKILVASYAERGTKENYDLENRLFYNLKANSIFKEKAPNELIFEKSDKTEEQPFIYDYMIKTESEINNEKLCGKNRLAHWENIELKKSFPNKPERYFATLRDLEISNDKNKKPDSKTVIKYASDYTGAFGLKITLTVPESNKGSHPASVMKPLLDGVICAFHGEKGETVRMLQEKFKGENITCQANNWNVLGDQDYLRKYGNGFKWYPADEANRLKFGWIIVKCEGEKYKMSGEIYKWD